MIIFCNYKKTNSQSRDKERNRSRTEFITKKKSKTWIQFESDLHFFSRAEFLVVRRIRWPTEKKKKKRWLRWGGRALACNILTGSTLRLLMPVLMDRRSRLPRPWGLGSLMRLLCCCMVCISRYDHVFLHLLLSGACLFEGLAEARDWWIFGCDFVFHFCNGGAIVVLVVGIVC